MRDCSFCCEFLGDDGGSYYLKNVASIVGGGRIRLESPRFYVYPSVGSLISGHLLIVPKAHYTALSMACDDELRELDGVVKDVQKIQSKILLSTADYFIFEHGIIDVDKSMMNCVDHAHLHLLPLSVDLSVLSFVDFLPIKLLDLNGLNIDQSDYIFYGNSREAYVALDKDKHPQYLRKRIHEQLGLNGHWNWRNDPQVDKIREWLRLFEEFVEGEGLESIGVNWLRLKES